MSDVNGLSQLELATLLEITYPNMVWRLDGNQYEGLTVLPNSPTPKPSLAELRAIDPAAARQKLADRLAYAARVSAFFTQYPVEVCVTNILQAILKPANDTFAKLKQDADLVAMKNYWQSLK